MGIPLNEEGVTDQEVVSEGQFEHPISRRVWLAKAMSTMDALKTMRRGTHMSVPIPQKKESFRGWSALQVVVERRRP